MSPNHALVLFMPHLNPFLPLLLVKFVLIQNSEKTKRRSVNTEIFLFWESFQKLALPLRQQLLSVQIARRVDFFVVVSELSLHSVRGEEHRRLWGAVDVVT